MNDLYDSPFDNQPHVLLVFPDIESGDDGDHYPSQVYGPFPDRRSADVVAKRTMAYSTNAIEVMRLEPPLPEDVPSAEAKHPEHADCADACGLEVTHPAACRDKPGGRVICTDVHHVEVQV